MLFRRISKLESSMFYISSSMRAIISTSDNLIFFINYKQNLHVNFFMVFINYDIYYGYNIMTSLNMW